MTSAPAEQLARAFAATELVIAGLTDTDWTAPTPCTEWNVRDLVDHLVTGNDRFTSSLGEPVTPRTDAAAADLLGAYRDSAAALVTAFDQPDVLERVITVPFGSVPGIVALHLRITEVLVHGWDLASATGRAGTFPEDLAEQELAFSRAKLGDIPADRTPFGAPQPVADDAPAIDRLAACLGRTVTA